MTEDAPDAVLLFPESNEAGGGPVAVTYPDRAEPLFGRTLRVGLAMRGGISLAVWIGGAVGELDLLRRIRWVKDGDSERCFFLWPSITPPDGADEYVFSRARVYARLIRSRGYDHVEFDVLAGASAGGLNSVLYSVAQRAGSRLDAVLGVWVEQGAFWKLLRRSGFRSVDAPLDGDGFFAPGVNAALHTLHTSETAVEAHRAHRLTLDVSATVIDTEDATERTARTGRAEFHFVAADHRSFANQPWVRMERGRDIPLPEGAAPSAGANDIHAKSLARLAYTGRSTSSLPGGFEPALIYSSTDARPEPFDKIDFSFAFNAQRQGFDKPFRVVDGGLTDNMPIDRAFNAIRNQPSDVFADRAIFYLDPDPDIRPVVRTPLGYSGAAAEVLLPVTPPPRRRTDPGSLFLTAVARAFGLRTFKESAEAKQDEVDAYRRGLYISQGQRSRLDSLSAALATGEYDRGDALRGYAAYRAAADADLVYGVLTNPAVWQLTTNLPSRHSFTALTTDDLLDLEHAFSTAYQPPGGESDDAAAWMRGAIFEGPLAVIDICRSLLAWVRALEDSNLDLHGTTRFSGIPDPMNITAAGDDAGTVASFRRAIYLTLNEAIDARDVSFLAVCDVGLAMKPSLHRPRADATPATRAARELLGSSVGNCSELVARLDGIARSLAEATSEVGPRIAGTMWAGFPSRADISSLDVAAFCSVAGIPDPVSDVRFWEISAGVVTDASANFTLLAQEDRRRTLNSILSLDRKSIVQGEVDRLAADLPLSVDAKLTGLSLRSFAGFLSGDWRRNDWLWGRLDAASGVIGFLHSLPHPSADALHDLAADVGAPGIDAKAAHDAILLETKAGQVSGRPRDLHGAGLDRARLAPFSPAPVSSDSPDDLRRKLRLGADSIANLDPGYRMGVTSRTLHVALRAIGRHESGLWAPVVTTALKPLTNLLASVVDLPRACVLLALLAGAWTVGSVSDRGGLGFARAGHPMPWPWYFSLLCIVAVAIVVVVVAQLIGAIRRWRAILSAGLATPLAGAPRAFVRSRFTRSLEFGVGQFIVGAAFLLGSPILHQVGWIGWASTVAGTLLGVVVTITAPLRLRAVLAANGYALRDAVVTGIALVSAAAFIVLPHPIGRLVNAFPTLVFGSLAFPDGHYQANLPLVIALVSAGISLVCNWGWQAGVRPSTASGTATRLRAVVAVLWWLAQAILVGAIGYVVTGPIQHDVLGNSPGYLARAGSACVALFVAGVAQWYLTQFDSLYTPSDGTKR